MKKSKKGATSNELLFLSIAVLIGGAIMMALVFPDMATKGAGRAKTAAEESAEDAGARSLKVLEVYFEDGKDSSPGSVDYMYATLKLAPGSEQVSLRSLSVQIELENTTSYIFNQSLNCSSKNESAPESIYNPKNIGYFGVNYGLESRGERVWGVIAQGDIATICMKSQRSITNDEKIRVQINLGRGVVPFSLEREMPQNINIQKIQIYKMS